MAAKKKQTENDKTLKLIAALVVRLKHMEKVMARHGIMMTPHGGSIWDDIQNAITGVAQTVSNVLPHAVQAYQTIAPLLQEGGNADGGDIFSDIGSFLGLGVAEDMMNDRRTTNSRNLQKQSLFDPQAYQKYLANKLIDRKKKAGDYAFDGGDYKFDGGEYDFEGGSTKQRSRILDRKK